MASLTDHVNPQLHALLARVLHEMVGSNDGVEFEIVKDEFVFHLTECLEDLEQFVALCKSPESYSLQSAEGIVQALLYHAVGHLISACRKYDYVPDPFRELDAEGNCSKGRKVSGADQEK